MQKLMHCFSRNASKIKLNIRCYKHKRTKLTRDAAISIAFEKFQSWSLVCMLRYYSAYISSQFFFSLLFDIAMGYIADTYSNVSCCGNANDREIT